MPTFKLTLEYEGTAYAGWQRQPDQPTVQAALETAIRQVTQRYIPVIGAGRTDAGVHALGQVASFRSEKGLDATEWLRALNGLLPPDISVRSVEPAADDFHARYSALTKLYEYRILNQPQRSALYRNRAWHLYGRLDLATIREAASLLVGRHDFSSFQGHPTDTENPVCDLQRLDLIHEPPLVRIEAQADRFLKQMVRAIVGTLVEVGQGKRPPQAMKDILAAKDRRSAGVTAPAHGLYLVRVDY
ncbi:MAG: tRNA pseudouridine(38-40) synthase TruA [Nitrospirae bacterium]|nr:tRNA pseudouridine(38-40) synthase TruA [Nitrospirota bacterium]